jgi:hypothetical protein
VIRDQTGRKSCRLYLRAKMISLYVCLLLTYRKYDTGKFGANKPIVERISMGMYQKRVLNPSAVWSETPRRGISCCGVSYKQRLGIPDERLSAKGDISFSFYVAVESRVKQSDFPRIGFKLPVKSLLTHETVLWNTAASRGGGWGEEKTKDYNSAALGLYRSVRTF